jgi:hypothetical protein
VFIAFMLVHYFMFLEFEIIFEFSCLSAFQNMLKTSLSPSPFSFLFVRQVAQSLAKVLRLLCLSRSPPLSSAARSIARSISRKSVDAPRTPPLSPRGAFSFAAAQPVGPSTTQHISRLAPPLHDRRQVGATCHPPPPIAF